MAQPVSAGVDGPGASRAHSSRTSKLTYQPRKLWPHRRMQLRVGPAPGQKNMRQPMHTPDGEKIKSCPKQAITATWQHHAELHLDWCPDLRDHILNPLQPRDKIWGDNMA
eukprot:scaffold582_cov385-Prasinococcus_capsulatus_cf.AAC.21